MWMQVVSFPKNTWLEEVLATALTRQLRGCVSALWSVSAPQTESHGLVILPHLYKNRLGAVDLRRRVSENEVMAVM